MCLSGVKQYPMRVKCATLSWHTLVSAFENKKEPVTSIIGGSKVSTKINVLLNLIQNVNNLYSHWSSQLI